MLQAAGLLPSGNTGLDAYRTDRSPGKLWNDTWGNPLIVVYAVFQPERFVRTFDNQNRRDFLLRKCLDSYGHNRAVYVAVGSIGASSDSSILATWSATDDAQVMTAYWNQIRSVARAHEWTEASSANAPWTSTRRLDGRYNGSKYRCLLSAPIEIR